MQKLYSRINWENEPSIETPLNEQNLNRMDAALDGVDNRVISQDTTKADKTELNDLVSGWVMDEETGIITVTKKSGEKILFDLNIEKIPVGFSLSDNGILTMTTDDGTKFTANIGAMIPVLTFNNSDTIAVSVSGAGINKTYSFSIKNGSVTEEKLQPNFLSAVKVEVAKAEASVDEAEGFAKQSQSYAVGTGSARPNEATDNAKSYYEKSKEIYDSLEGSGNVTGVKGSAETSYRTGKVNLTPENIGALPLSGANLFFSARTTDGNFTGDINTIYGNGAYWCQNATNKPTNDAYGLLIVHAAGTTDAIKQTYIPHIGNGLMGAARERIRVNDVWSPWRVMETEGSNLVCGNCFYMIDNGGRKRMVLQSFEDGSGANNYGAQIVIGAGGNTFIGAGESASSLYTALQTESNKKANEIYGKNGENMFISSDGHLYLYSNANQIANRKGICFNTEGILLPIGKDSISLGTSAYPFNLMCAKSIYIANNSANGIMFGDESVMIFENNNRLSLHATNGVSIDSGILYFGSGTSERIELTNRMLKLSGYNGIQFNSYIRSDICPTDNGAYKLGLSSYRWKEIWCSTSLNTSSDKNLKKNISDLSSDERYVKFFMLLQPKSYLFKDGESGRTHVGFISQDVEEAMAVCGLSSLEFAGFCKDHKVKEEWTERKEKRIKEPLFDDDGNPVYEYSLRYEEFIALNTMMIQSQQDRISEMEDRIEKIEEELKRKDDIYGIY